MNPSEFAVLPDTASFDRAVDVARAAIRADGLGVAPTFEGGQVLASEFLRLVETLRRAGRAL